MKFVFDFGGVLFDWRPAVLLAQTWPHRVSDAASAAHWVRQIYQTPGGGWGDFDRGLIDAEALAQRIAGRTELALDEARTLIAAVPGHLQPIPETVALLARLRATGRPLYYLSNMPEPYADHLERSHEVVGWFDDGVFSARVGLLKPEPEIFALAARQFAVPPAELLFLDDLQPNVDAARAAGWNALQFSDAASCEQALREHGWWPDEA